MLLLIVICIYPFIYIISYSLSDPSSFSGGFLLFPKGFNYQAYIVAFSTPALLNAFLISVLRTIIGPIMMVIVTSMAAYSLTLDKLPGVKFFRKYFILTMYFSGGLIPFYIIVKSLMLSGTFLVYIIPLMVSVFSMVLIKTYIESLPAELSESAFIDGANEFVVYWKILFPICKPIIAAVILFDAVNQWNSFMDTQFFNTMERSLYTLQYVLYLTLSATVDYRSGSLSQYSNVVNPQSLKMAITIITVIPITLVYPFLQKYFAKGLLIGAIKG